MTLEQLMVRIERQRLRYAFVLADLRAAGEPICAVTADQVLLAELAGYVVNLRSGDVRLVPGYRPLWLNDIANEQAGTPFRNEEWMSTRKEDSVSVNSDEAQSL